MSCWHWISTSQNIADWVTRPGRSPSELGRQSSWFRGPDFMYLPIEQWGMESNPNVTGPLPGEKMLTKHTHTIKCIITDSYNRVSKPDILIWAYARVIACCKMRSFSGGATKHITPELLKDAELLLIKEAQSSWDAKSIKLQFRTLTPVLQDNLWVVGDRISKNSPFNPENKPQILLPPKHSLTKLLMMKAHRNCGHKHRDETMANFRSRYWTSHCSKIADGVCNNCQLCKLKKIRLLEQRMGEMQPERLLPAPAFTHTMLDLFGPYNIRGEAQKRISLKVWGVIFTDLCCRATHIELVCGYDTDNFLLALARFASIRGYPSTIFSDPGSQLVGADNELQQAWLSMDRDLITKAGTERGLKWVFGPPDGPWYQGAVESLVKVAKHCIRISIGNQRLSLPEMTTVLYQIANLMNERPLGTLPGHDSEISILTPNSLLLGRSTASNPGGYESQPTLRSRITLVENTIRHFWSNWTQLFAPTLVKHNKWRQDQPELKVGDIVAIADSNTLKGEYRLGRVVKLIPSKDHRIRRVAVAYKRYKVGEKVHEYAGATDTVVERPVQRLGLLVSVDDINPDANP